MKLCLQYLFLTTALGISSVMAADLHPVLLRFTQNGGEFKYNGYVEERCVLLQDQKLTGEIPKEIERLTSMTWFSIKNNQLTGEIPEGLWALPNLREVVFHGNALFGQRIMTSGRKIEQVNHFFSVQTQVNGGCDVHTSGVGGLDSHFTDDGVWQEELMWRDVQFAALSLPLQALFIVELANYGVMQRVEFTFKNKFLNIGESFLTIGSGEFGPRLVWVSDPRLNALKEELETLHMPLGEFRTLAENGEHPVGLIHLEQGKQTKSANKI